jgi:phosphate transport system substrate-binding protein
MRFVRGMIAGLGCLGAVGCAGAPTAEPPSETEAPVVRIVGADTMMSSLMPALVETYNRSSDTRFELSTLPTEQAMRALFDREADLVASGRPPRPSEEEQAQALGFSLDGEQSRHLVGVDVIGVAVHPSSPISHLTYDQVIGVFCTREITDGSALGGTAGPLKVMVPELEDVATRGLFENFFCGVRGIHAKIELGAPDEIRSALAGDPMAISFVSASEGAGKMLALTPNADVPPVKPTQDNIIRGSYPLYGDVYLLTRGTPVGALASFVDWIASPAGQEVVDEQRLVPLFLRPERLDEPRPLRETIHFEPGSSEPDARSQARLGVLIDEIKERKLRHVILEGFTDGEEPDAFRLSESRAQTVRALLAPELEGLEAHFEIIPRGPKNPIAPNNTPYGRQINRRVQVYLAEDERGGGNEAVVVADDPPAEGVVASGGAEGEAPPAGDGEP